MKVAGKVAIVTGTSPNIGGGIAGGLAVDLRVDAGAIAKYWLSIPQA